MFIFIKVGDRMSRKRLTQVFPFLLPLRKRQRLALYYLKIARDGNRYANHFLRERLEHLIYETSCPMVNRETGFDILYQQNKVFNLKLAAATIDHLVLEPGESFSFWNYVRHADKRIAYKDGLIVIDGRLTTAPGGGLCQLSNLLFIMFLHTPLTVLERHGHSVKDFPEPPSDAPLGVDATVLEGWLDLKVKNDTAARWQIEIAFDEERIYGRVFTDADDGLTYRVGNGDIFYIREGEEIVQEVDVLRETISPSDGTRVSSELLYTNRCVIGYPLPVGTPVAEKGETP
jgi:vancomycin resistance protein VanW